MDDEAVTGWHLPPEQQRALRLQKIRQALDTGDAFGAAGEAEELLDEDPEHTEGLYLLGEAMLAIGDAESAADVYGHYLELVGGGDPNGLLGLAVARFETCDLPGAVEAAREAVRLSPELAGAHYYLGLALERLPGRSGESLASLAAANQLHPAAFPFPLELSERDWDEALAAAVASLLPSLQEFWNGIAVRYLVFPALEELRRTTPPITPTVTGLYEGTPPEEGDPWRERPRSLRLFTGNLSRCNSLDEVIDQIGRTLEHEALDWLGIAPEDLPDYPA